MRKGASSRAVALVTALAFVGGTTLPTIAFAQPKGAAKAAKKKGLRDSLTGDAKEAFERGVTLYTNKNFEGALTEFERAYQVAKDPRLLFNMAVAERDMKRYSRALARLQQELKEGEGTLSDEEKQTAQAVLDGLKQFTAPLTVTTNEPGATVLVDGLEVGTTPLSAPLTVDVGERQVTLKKAGFLEASKRVNISGGNASTIEIPLDVVEKKGKLVVKAIGAPAVSVFVDGVERGPAPWEGEVKADKHTVELRAKGFVTESRTETVEFKSTHVIEVTLRPDQARVVVEVNKDDAVITIDKQEVGKGRWQGVLPSGGHQLVVTRDGYEPFTQELTVATDADRNVAVTLVSKGGVGWYWWVLGGAVIVGGGVATYFATRPKPQDPVAGTINPGTVPVGIRF